VLGVYEKKFIKRTNTKYSGNLGGPAGADHLCQQEFGSGWKALLVGGGRRASQTPFKADGQSDWVVAKYTHYFNESGEPVWRTESVPLLGVLGDRRSNVYNSAFVEDGIYAWGGYVSDWTTAPERPDPPSGSCAGWTTSAPDVWGAFPLVDLTVVSIEPCSKMMPLLCIEQ
jgi:hypothetical protein